MRQKARAQIEQRLQAERERLMENVRQLDDAARDAVTEDGDLTTYPLHLADEGTDAMEREKELLLLSAEGRQLYEIDEALRRLFRDPDGFGTCERCGREIEKERLELVPWTRFCIECQNAVENELPPST